MKMRLAKPDVSVASLLSLAHSESMVFVRIVFFFFGFWLVHLFTCLCLCLQTLLDV